jgi:hypothetical protein
MLTAFIQNLAASITELMWEKGQEPSVDLPEFSQHRAHCLFSHWLRALNHRSPVDNLSLAEYIVLCRLGVQREEQLLAMFVLAQHPKFPHGRQLAVFEGLCMEQHPE